MLSSDTELFMGYDGELIFASNKKDSIPKTSYEKDPKAEESAIRYPRKKKGAFVYVISSVYVEGKRNYHNNKEKYHGY